jgi:hypothetical protein
MVGGPFFLYGEMGIVQNDIGLKKIYYSEKARAFVMAVAADPLRAVTRATS